MGEKAEELREREIKFSRTNTYQKEVDMDEEMYYDPWRPKRREAQDKPEEINEWGEEFSLSAQQCSYRTYMFGVIALVFFSLLLGRRTAHEWKGPLHLDRDFIDSGRTR